MTDNTIRAEDFDPPLTGKQVEQVQEVINEALRRRLAETTEPVELKLSDYKGGQAVEVFHANRGVFIPGTVSSVEKKLNLVYVNTDRGPITVASTRNIRPSTI